VIHGGCHQFLAKSWGAGAVVCLVVTLMVLSLRGLPGEAGGKVPFRASVGRCWGWLRVGDGVGCAKLGVAMVAW
jgi:hypothetical protein